MSNVIPFKRRMRQSSFPHPASCRCCACQAPIKPTRSSSRPHGAALWRDNLDENGAAIRMRSGGRGVSWSRRTRTDASPL